ncbi:MAG: 50S ribosomal protein L10 [Pseudomonadota bacterium]
MALRLEEKMAIVASVNQTASSALSLVVADARGVNVTDITALRKQAREQGVSLRVIKNSLARRAFKGTEFECLEGELTGPSLYGFSMEDPGAAARLFKEFAKQNAAFDIKVLSIGGQVLDGTRIDVLATLPTREQALAQLAAVLIAPITKLVRTFNEVPAKITRVMAAVRDQKRDAA